MFGNNNDNQNFNNGRSIFSNNFSNNINNSFNDNNQNNNFGVNNNLNSFNPNVNPYMNSNQVPINNFSGNNVDMPPELDQIKNLNDSPIVSAPTMDVLNPMNIMPENPNGINDRLDAYESGNLNNFNNTDQGFNMPYENANFNNLNAGHNMPHENTNFNINNDYSTPVNNPSYDLNNNFGMNNNMNSFNPNPYMNPNQTPINNFQNNTNFNNDFSNQFNNISHDPVPSYNPVDFNVNQSLDNNLINNPLNNVSNINNDISSYDHTKESNVPFDLNSLTDNASFESNSSSKEEIEKETKENNELEVKNENTDENNSYEIDNKTNLEDKEEKKVNLDDLGLDDVYQEPDSLEIMDLDSEDETKDVKETTEKETLATKIDKIKELLDNLKKDGSNINVEEFDFEDMIQLIIKIEK